MLFKKYNTLEQFFNEADNGEYKVYIKYKGTNCKSVYSTKINKKVKKENIGGVINEFIDKMDYLFCVTDDVYAGNIDVYFKYPGWIRIYDNGKEINFKNRKELDKYMKHKDVYAKINKDYTEKYMERLKHTINWNLVDDYEDEMYRLEFKIYRESVEVFSYIAEDAY